MHRVAVLGKDGIGEEVIESSKRVIREVTDEIEFEGFEGGYQVYQECGDSIRKQDLEEIRGMDAILFGSTTTPFDEPDYRSLILTLRQKLDLYANLRIIPDLWNDKEVYIVRENSEGLYSGKYERTEDRVEDSRVITRQGSERITEFAFDIAERIGSNEITLIHKANVLQGDKFFRKIVMKLAEDRGINVNEGIIDAFTIQIVNNFWDHQVMLSENLFGDIISDLSSIHARSIGIIPTENYGDEIALFEPMHGSAPEIAGNGISNPIGSILSSAMMMNYLDLDGDLVWDAVRSYVRSGDLTFDLDGNSSTEEVTDGIISEIQAKRIKK